MRAQEALERVYYSHQMGASRPFEDAVPRALLEHKVRTYLKQSVALERFWNTPVTAEMLRAEMERMVSRTRMPDRLAELFAALGHDPVLIEECLARPALVSRLARNFFAYDETIHAEARREAELLRDALANGLIHPWTEHPARSLLHLVRSGAGEPAGDAGEDVYSRRNQAPGPSRVELESDEFDRLIEELPGAEGETGPIVEERETFLTRVLLEREAGEVRIANFMVQKKSWDIWWEKVAGGFDERSVEAVASVRDSPRSAARRVDGGWGESDVLAATDATQTASGSACVADDSWDNGAMDDTPWPRSQHSAVWTGSVMVVWGGYNVLNKGGRYDPATDTWTPTSTTNSPINRRQHTAVWTGSLMLVWGGFDSSGTMHNTGGRYDPLADNWAPTSTTNAPEARTGQTAVWTGSLMVVWGGVNTDGFPLDTGGRYDPVTDVWTSTSTTGAPAGRAGGGHTAVWTGSHMLVWGGGESFNTGGRYDPSSDTWAPTSTINAPAGRTGHTAVWTGSLMVVWGGYQHLFGTLYAAGGRYDPVTDSWEQMSTMNVPTARYGHTAIWTGILMVVWGGVYLETGGRYDPVTDTWEPTSTTNAPVGRHDHTAVWTGNRMVVWGGYDPAVLNSGGRYDPATDTWTPTAVANLPYARYSHTAVWTGNQMVVWGGLVGTITSIRTNTGGRYDPATDTWTPTSTVDAPQGRERHTAVWTGTEMVVWGGSYLSTGGRYDPVADTWRATSTTNAPVGRLWHTAVWTGTEMVVWGGYDGAEVLNTGGRYDASTDTWRPVSTDNAPAPRREHTAVWTGSQMVAWGGSNVFSVLNTGGRYDPVTDMWTPTSETNAPQSRAEHGAVWTGSVMVVWGGFPSNLNSGGRYNPATDAWVPTSTTNAPAGRSALTVVWTGNLMIVWGGVILSNSGGRYDPVADTWTATSIAGAPLRRNRHTAVWTGEHMIVWGGVGPTDFNDGGRYCACSEVVYYQDSDGDGYGAATVFVRSCKQPSGFVVNGADCDDANGSVWGTPTEVQDLLFSDQTTLVWTPPADPGATSIVYDAIRSEEAADFVTVAVCVSADGPAASVTDLGVPLAGRGFYYLVRAQNACPGGEGSLGTDSNGTRRSARSCP